MFLQIHTEYVHNTYILHRKNNHVIDAVNDIGAANIVDDHDAAITNIIPNAGLEDNETTEVDMDTPPRMDTPTMEEFTEDMDEKVEEEISISFAVQESEEKREIDTQMVDDMKEVRHVTLGRVAINSISYGELESNADNVSCDGKRRRSIGKKRRLFPKRKRMTIREKRESLKSNLKTKIIEENEVYDKLGF